MNKARSEEIEFDNDSIERSDELKQILKKYGHLALVFILFLGFVSASSASANASYSLNDNSCPINDGSGSNDGTCNGNPTLGVSGKFNDAVTVEVVS